MYPVKVFTVCSLNRNFHIQPIALKPASEWIVQPESGQNNPKNSAAKSWIAIPSKTPITTLTAALAQSPACMTSSVVRLLTP